LKEWHAVATRYEKTACSFMGVLCLAAARDWLKGAIKGKQSSSNRTWDALLTFYDFPAEHWDHLRTSNPIESVFATVRHRTGADQRRRHCCGNRAGASPEIKYNLITHHPQPNPPPQVPVNLQFRSARALFEGTPLR
jgi:hypothetical protein